MAFHRGLLWTQAVAFASITQDDDVILSTVQIPHEEPHEETHHEQLLSALHDFASEYYLAQARIATTVTPSYERGRVVHLLLAESTNALSPDIVTPVVAWYPMHTHTRTHTHIYDTHTHDTQDTHTHTTTTHGLHTDLRTRTDCRAGRGNIRAQSEG